ncbi:FeoB small GTPase domain-containing protein [Verrucomicrobium spinosum]|uniref:FeoB small GTPase domain-containing protein n=1 Tax=Verrucomicrobium spinosum TaxID=2736 RepID=UPI000A72EA76|nr:FeoB small GTPase domain-containing protein [Verrucomicrobium spinosum]
MSVSSAALPEAAPTSATREPVIAIVGNPNCGKSTIFNALTGLKQKVANYPGVTVEKREGSCFSQHGKRLRLLDLPAPTVSMHALRTRPWCGTC